MAEHRIAGRLLEREVRVAVIGCGGTGSAIAGGLPRLHQCMRALGHPFGLDVTFYDADKVSRTNTVRQAFSAGDVGVPKAEIIAHRLNAFYGLDWRAVPEYFGGKRRYSTTEYELIISCVDTRAARSAINSAIGGFHTRYWLDCGNNAYDAQFVLGEPIDGWHDTPRGQAPLPTVADLFPETLEPEKRDPGPSCSAAEALRLQGPFVNETVATAALALLARLFTKGVIAYHGQFINLETGKAFPIAVPEPKPVEKVKAGPPAPGARRRRRERARAGAVHG